MTGTNAARVSHPAVPGAAARFPRHVARMLAWGPGQVDRAGCAGS